MTITQAQLTSEISSLWADNTTGNITPANARQTLNDMVTATFQGGSSPSFSILNLTKTTPLGLAPGAGLCILQAVTGTNPGTCKIIIYAGTSNTPITIVDNVGSGF